MPQKKKAEEMKEMPMEGMMAAPPKPKAKKKAMPKKGAAKGKKKAMPKGKKKGGFSGAMFGGGPY